MRRYHFLQKDDVFDALNKVRDAFLAAKDGKDVEQIINGLLTFDERLKIGRRIQIAECLISDFSVGEIKSSLKVGSTTIGLVARNLQEYERCFNLVNSRTKRLETEYFKKAYRQKGGSTKVFKTREYTGFKRKDAKR